MTTLVLYWTAAIVVGAHTAIKIRSSASRHGSYGQAFESLVNFEAESNPDDPMLRDLYSKERAGRILFALATLAGLLWPIILAVQAVRVVRR